MISVIAHICLPIKLINYVMEIRLPRCLQPLLHFPLFPQMFVLSGVIAMVTCAVFLRLNSLLKLAVLLLAVSVYSYLIHLAFVSLIRQDMLHRSAPAQVARVIAVLCFSVIHFLADAVSKQ